MLHTGAAVALGAEYSVTGEFFTKRCASFKLKLNLSKSLPAAKAEPAGWYNSVVFMEVTLSAPVLMWPWAKPLVDGDGTSSTSLRR